MKKKRVVLVVEARVGSKRLPNKSLLHLAGEPLIYRILERLKKCKRVDNIVLASPNTPRNKVFKKIAKKAKVSMFFGANQNIVKRHLQVAKKYKTDVIVRVPGDNCVSEPKEVDKIINFHLNLKERSFTSNLIPFFRSGYPDGIGAEVFDHATLKEVSKKKLSTKQKEWLSINFFDYKKEKVINPKFCNVNTLKCPKSYRMPKLRLDVNTLSDYNFIKDIYDNLYSKKKLFSIKDVIKFLKRKKT